MTKDKLFSLKHITCEVDGSSVVVSADNGYHITPWKNGDDIRACYSFSRLRTSLRDTYQDYRVITEAEASFDESNTAPYARWYRARFDKASIIYKGEAVMVYPDDGEPYEAKVISVDRTVGEISYLADVILKGNANTVNSGEVASGSIKLCELITKSAEQDGEKIYL